MKWPCRKWKSVPLARKEQHGKLFWMGRYGLFQWPRDLSSQEIILWECMDIHFNLALSLESFGYTGSLIQAHVNDCMAAVSFQWLLNSWPRKSGSLNAILTSWTYQKGANYRIFKGTIEEPRQMWSYVHTLRECW